MLKERARASKRKRTELTIPGAAEVLENQGVIMESHKKSGTKRRRRVAHLKQRSNKKQKLANNSCDFDSIPAIEESDNEDVECKMSEWVALGVPHPLRKALGDLTFYRPTEIQRRAIPLVAIGNNDLIGAAETVRIEIYMYYSYSVGLCAHINFDRPN